MKTLNFAMALALMGGAAQAGTVFEVPINGGIARIQLDDDCEQSMCASLSWSENDRRQDRKEPAKPSARLKADPAEKLTPSGPAPATQPPAKASRESGENVAPAAAPALEPSTVASIEPSQPAVSAIKTSAASPVGEWMVEDGEARIRIEECGNNLCGVVSGAKNAKETDRKNPNPELRNRPIIGMPVLLDMKPAKSNRWEGRIYNAKSGQTYTANISLNDPQRLRVEGCVFGGLVCGGQNWTRVN
jgi:uncharacterized protein (DUF2147 family)